MRTIATPAYQRIADELRREIVEGRLRPGDRLPSVPELAERHGVSERTAFEAHRILLGEGLTDSRPGSGTYVAEQPDVIRMARSWYDGHLGTSPWRASMAEIGRDGSWRSSSEPVPAVPAIAQRLGIEAGERVMRTDYVFTLDGKPAFLSRSFEPMELTAGTDVLLPEAGPHAGLGVARRMELIGHPPTWCQEDVLPHDLTAHEAAALGLRVSTRTLLLWRTYFEGDEPDLRPLETADIVLPRWIRPRYRFPISR